MKNTLFIIAMLSFSTAWGATDNDKKDALIDSCLVVSNEMKTRVIEQGKRIFVKVEERKIQGVYMYDTDSTIYVDGIQLKLSEIDMIARPKTGKTVGMFFVQLPISIMGFAIMAVSSGYGGPLGVAGGVAIIGVGVTGATMESYRGKRYRAFRKGKRKWDYSVRLLK